MKEVKPMKLYKAILHTGGKTRQQIIKMFDAGQTPVEDEIARTTEFYNMLDGSTVYVTDVQDSWSLVAWPDEENARMKEAIWLAEQDPMFGSYLGERESFDKDFDNGEYFPDAMLCFDAADVEIIEALKPEKSK